LPNTGASKQKEEEERFFLSSSLLIGAGLFYLLKVKNREQNKNDELVLPSTHKPR